MTKKDLIKQWFIDHPDRWISTRDLRIMFGEAADRRLRELKGEGFQISSKRRELPDKRLGFTFFWSHPTNQQGELWDVA